MRNSPGFRLRVSHQQGFSPKQQRPSSVPAPVRLQEERSRRSQEQQRVKAEAKLDSVKQRLLERFGDTAPAPLDFAADKMATSYKAAPDRYHFMSRIAARIDLVARDAVRVYVTNTGRFWELEKVLRQYCSHLLALEADAVETYVQLEIRHALDAKLVEFERLLAALDKRRQAKLHPLDPKTYEALLSREIGAIQRYDLYRLAQTILTAVEQRMVEVVDRGELQEDFHSVKGYQAVRCRIGHTKRTTCFFIVEPATQHAPSRVITLQTPSEFAKRQRRPKPGITKNSQRFAQRPKHLRHLPGFCPISGKNPAPVSAWTRGLFRLKMGSILMDIHISHFSEAIGQTVTIHGWAQNVRSSGSIAFIQVRDGSGFVQAVISKASVDAASWEAAIQTSLESTVEVTGVIAKHPKQEGVFELQATVVALLQKAEEYPLGKKEHGPDFLLDNRHLWLRAPSQWAIQRVRDCIIRATYEWFHQHDYVKIDSPILTPNACEGTTELFEIDYFGERSAYLSQSGQLYLEAAIASVGRCFDFGPVFRAEKSKTRRHLIEFWMMDAEAAFVDHEGNMRIQEQLIEHIVTKVLAECRPELAILERDVKPLENVKAPFYRLTHAEAIKKLRELGSDIGEMDDLGADDETTLTKLYDKPIFVEKYPTAVKAFYMKRDPQDPSHVLNSDLLAPEGYGEISGGSQREDDYEKLLERIREHQLPEDAFRWYLDLRKYGSAPHSGFGYGLERIVAWICGLHHVRETIPFPRLINRLEP